MLSTTPSSASRSRWKLDPRLLLFLHLLLPQLTASTWPKSQPQLHRNSPRSPTTSSARRSALQRRAPAPLPIRPHYGDSRCDDKVRAGDCSLQHCSASGLGQACEARYVRFIRADGRDYSRKTCRCISEPVCTLLPADKQGCANYMDLSAEAQRAVRRWTMSEADRKAAAAELAGSRLPSQHRREHRKRAPLRILSAIAKSGKGNNRTYTDARRHAELIDGRTRFCCHVSRQLSKRAEFLAWSEDYADAAAGSPATHNVPHLALLTTISAALLLYTAF